MSDIGTPSHSGLPPNNEESDPWAAAQKSDFVYRPSQDSGQGQPVDDSAGHLLGASYQTGWGAVPGSRLDTDPYAEKKIGPLSRGESDEVRAGKRLAAGCFVVAVLVGIAGIVAVVMYYRTTTRSGIEAIEAGLAAKARSALNQAVRDQQTYFAQNDRFTDDPVELMRQGTQLRYVTGTDVDNLEDVAVKLCNDVEGVLIQKRVTKSTYFAAFLNSRGAYPYWARDQQACPNSLDENGTPGGPWSLSDGVLTGEGSTGQSTHMPSPLKRSPAPTSDDNPGPVFPSPPGRFPTPTEPSPYQ